MENTVKLLHQFFEVVETLSLLKHSPCISSSAGQLLTCLRLPEAGINTEDVNINIKHMDIPRMLLNAMLLLGWNKKMAQLNLPTRNFTFFST